MAFYVKFHEVAHHVFNLLNARITKFHDFAAVGAYNMIVLSAAVCTFIARKIATKLVTRYEVAIDEQLEGIVHGSSADAIALRLHVYVERLSIEVVGSSIDFFKNCKAFGGFALIGPL